MSARSFLMAVLPIVVLVAVGCGGDDSSSDTQSATNPVEEPSLTKDELIQQGDGICAEVNAAVGTLDESGADAATALGQEADLYSGMMERLQGLGTPDDDSGLQEVYAAGDNLVQAVDDAQLSAQRGDVDALAANEGDIASALSSFQSAAASYGFEDCGQGATAPTGTATAPSGTPATPVTPTTTTPAAPVTPATPTPAPAPTPAPSGGTGGGTTGGGTSGGSTGGGSSGGVGPG